MSPPDPDIQAQAEALSGICTPGDGWWKQRTKAIAAALQQARQEEREACAKIAHMAVCPSCADCETAELQIRARGSRAQEGK